MENKFKMAKYFTWNEFDQSVDFIANKCNKWEISSIYGIPRGGLCLAVALSHKLNIEITHKPNKYSLIVDDIFETGLTLNSFKNIEGAKFYVLFSKAEPLWWNTVFFCEKNDWIVFPWENKEKILIDQAEYKSRRIGD